MGAGIDRKAMRKGGLFCITGISWLIAGCNPYAEMAMLDKSIPQIETPNNQIATICTKTINGHLIQTRLLDRKGRIREEYNFGRSNSRVWNQYDGPLRTTSVIHFHSDSSGPGSCDSTTHGYKYDRQGRLQQEVVSSGKWLKEITYTYAANGDTLKSVQPLVPKYESTLAYIDQWTRNDRGQLVRHYLLYVIQERKGKVPDTLWHSSQRYAYSADGKRVLAWYDYMYLGQFYRPAGPDTIHYQYDRQQRLVGEQHRYTIDMRNKQEIDSTKLDSTSRYIIQLNRVRFFNGTNWLPKNEKTDIVQYHYDVFDPKRHLPLQIPPLD